MSTDNSRASRRSAVEKVLEQDDVIAKRVTRFEARSQPARSGLRRDPRRRRSRCRRPTRAASARVSSSPGRRSSKSASPRPGIVAAFVMMLAGFGWPLAAARVLAAIVSAPPIRTMSAAFRRAGRRTPPARKRLLSRASVEVGSRQSRQSRPRRLPARASHRSRSRAARPLRPRIAFHAGAAPALRRTSLWRSFSISARAARRSRSMRGRARGRRAGVQALRRAWRRGLVARRHRLSPRRRRAMRRR